MPKDLSRLQSRLERGLVDTADLWPDVRVGYRWVHQAAHILSNQDQREALTVQRRLGGLLGAMTRYQIAAGTLAPALGHFRQVTRSDWPGLFHCSSVPELPRTNNDLEQFFGAYRYHDRRTTGRKVASPSLVLSGVELERWKTAASVAAFAFRWFCSIVFKAPNRPPGSKSGVRRRSASGGSGAYVDVLGVRRSWPLSASRRAYHARTPRL